MTDELLPYYQRELAFIRKLGGEFARENPQSAAALELSETACDDPHAERMIMAFAFLTARIRRKLDDDFPEITRALLGVLYPHYQAPIPSMAITQFQLKRDQGALTKGYPIDRESFVETQPIDGEPCRFRTCYPVTLWPIEVESAVLGGMPSDTPVFPKDATGLLRLRMRCFAKDMTFEKLELPTLRFFLNGQSQHVYLLYELLLNDTLEITVANADGKAAPVRLGRDAIRPVGFEEGEGLLPYNSQSHLGYRLLSEYFAFPEKFLFVDIDGLTPERRNGLGNEIEVCFYLRRTIGDLESNVDARTFRLGCTPIVNLFPKQADPVRLTHHGSEYRVVPDARRTAATEVYSIDRVVGTAPDGRELDFRPFYSFTHSVDRDESKTFWHSTRKPSVASEHRVDHGTEVFISFVDLDFETVEMGDWIAGVTTTCMNRDLPGRLPFGGGQPVLKLTGGGPLDATRCLTKPTSTVRPELAHGQRWRLVSHLSLNHLSITDLERRPEALREILRLYDFVESPQNVAKTGSILEVGSERTVARVRDETHDGFCRGTDVHIRLDEDHFSDKGLYLFASVLERFLGLYCSLNSFTRLSIKTKKSKEPVYKWPPRAGNRILL